METVWWTEDAENSESLATNTQSLTFSHTKFQSPASKIIAEERNRP
jgi:hypothetical protein